MPKISPKIIIPPQERQELIRLGSECRKAISPFKKSRLLSKQVIVWNTLAAKQSTNEAAFYCGAKTGLISKQQDNLPVFKQLNAIGNFCERTKNIILVQAVVLKIKATCHIAAIRQKLHI